MIHSMACGTQRVTGGGVARAGIRASKSGVRAESDDAVSSPDGSLMFWMGELIGRAFSCHAFVLNVFAVCICAWHAVACFGIWDVTAYFWVGIGQE